MSVDDATLIVTLRDETSGPLNKIATSLEKFNTLTGNSNAQTQKLEQQSAKLAAGIGSLGGGLDKSSAAYIRATAAAAGYEAQLKRISGIQIRPGGAAVNASGQFISNAELDQALIKARALQAIQSGAGLKTGSFLNASGDVQNVGANAEKAASSLSKLGAISNSTRYALYSTSQALGTLGVGLLAIPVASAVLAMNYERDFATVQRATLITGAAAVALKAELINLSTEIPVTFKNITEIAAAGAQLGISDSGLVNFTRVVAQLTATTNLSAEAAQNFLGKFRVIAGVDPSQFSNLGAAILNIGVHTAATEQQIAKLGTQIVGIGQQAGFTVPQILGIAGALASVSSVGVELGRGTITQFVTKMQIAVETGGPALEAFANTAHVSASTVQAAWGTSKFADLFVKFFKGLDEVNKAGGNTPKILNDIGITSIRQLPLLLNLGQGWKTLRDSINLGNEGWANASILATHFAVINDTLKSKLIELGGSFGKFMDQIGSASTGPLKDVVLQMTDFVKGLSDFASTKSGQEVLIWAAGLAVALGVLSLLGSGLTKMVATVQAGQVAYSGITKEVEKFKAAQLASSEASLTGMSGLQRFATFLTNPYVIAIGVAIAGLALFSNELEKLKATDQQVYAGLASAKSFGDISKLVTKGGAGGNLPLAAAGANALPKFANFSTSIKAQTQSNKVDAGLNAIPGLAAFAKFNDSIVGTLTGLGRLDASTQLFRDDMGRVGGQLATLAGSDMPAAQNAFRLLADKTDGTKSSLVTLLGLMGGPYKAELDRQLAINHLAATTANELALAYGGVGKGALDAAKSGKILSDETKRQADFQNNVLQIVGSGGQKAIDDYGAAYQKSIQPLTDFNAIVGQVQKTLNDAATAQAAAAGKGSKASNFYDGASVSLSQFTAQLVDNNAKQAEWFTNVMAISNKYGTEAASVFIQAGYSAVNNSILKQLLDNVGGQGDAYIAAQKTKMDEASAATGEALIAGGNLMKADGGKISDETAKEMGKRLLAGFSPADIMKEFNLQFNDNPAKPKIDDTEAKRKLQDFMTSLGMIPRNVTVGITLQGQAAATQQINTIRRAAGLSNVFAYGGYTGAGAKFQEAGIVHAGEFVFPQEAVARIGIPQLYAMMRGSMNAQAAPAMGYANGGLVGGGGTFASLDAKSLQAILQLSTRPIVLYTDDRLIAESAGRGNQAIAYGGGN